MHRAVTTVCRRLLQVTSKTSSQTPQVSSISPGRRITSCATQKATDVKYRTDLKNVTIIDTCSRAAFAIDKLLRLPSERKVAWSTQHAPHHSFAPNTPTVTAAVFAGGDVDFGNGSYMFICAGDVAERQRIWKLFQTYFEDEAVRKVWFDYPISAHHLSLLGITTRGYVADIHQLLGMNNRKGLPLDLDILSKEVVFSRKKAKAKRVLNYNDLSIQTPRPWLEPPTTPEQNPDRVWIARACHDASQIYHIEARLDDTLRPCQVHNHNSIFNLRQSFRRFFAPFSDLLHDMYRTGVHISPHKLSQQQHDATESIESLELKFRHWAFWHSPDAWHMDLASSSQLRQLLFAPIANARNADDKLDAEKQFEITDATGNMRRINIKGVGLRPVSYTPCGWPSVSKSALKKAAGEQTKSSEPDDGEFRSAIHALVKSQEIRRLHESCETFISRNRRKNERVGVRHVVQAVSGRVENEISCRKWKYRLQGGISAAEGNGLLIVRYEDAEFVAMVNLTRCERLKERVGSRECDMTSLLASELSNEVYDAWRKGDVTMKKGKGGVEDRFEQAYHAAKMLDIGMRHGGSAEVIAAKVGCTRGEANELALRWYEAHPGVAEWRVESERFVMRNGFLESRMGRRRHVKKKWPRDRASAMGYAVSGTAGEMVMGGMLSLNRDENVKGLRWNIVFADREFVVLEGPIEALECVRESIVEAAEKPEGVGFEFLKPRVVLMEEEDLGGIGERGIAIEGKSFGRRGGDGGGLWGVDGRIGVGDSIEDWLIP